MVARYDAAKHFLACWRQAVAVKKMPLGGLLAARMDGQDLLVVTIRALPDAAFLSGPLLSDTASQFPLSMLGEIYWLEITNMALRSMQGSGAADGLVAVVLHPDALRSSRQRVRERAGLAVVDVDRSEAA